MHFEILAPAALLALWTVVMLGWTLIVTGAAFRQAGLDVSSSPPGSRGQDLAGRLPARSLWPSHNYTHLAEQPVAFYPVILIMAMVGFSALDLALAWAYVCLRILHSCWQATINTLPTRFALFFSASVCLAILAVRALIRTL